MQGSIEIYKIKSDKKTKMKLRDLEEKMDRDLIKKQNKRREQQFSKLRKLRKKGVI